VPYLPYRDRNPTTGDFDGAGPVNDFLQAALPQICSQLRNGYRFSDANFNGLVNAANAPGRAVAEFVCSPYPYDPPDPPSVPPAPVYSQGGFSFGSITTRWRQTFPTVNEFDEVLDWELPPDGNVGLPTGGPRLTTTPTGFLVVGMPTLRPGDEEGFDNLSSQYNPSLFEFLGITQYSVNGDDGDGNPVQPRIVLPPTTPPPPTVLPPVERPEFPININFPNIPGLPDFEFPVTYSPDVSIDGGLSFPLSFSPRVDIAPEFAFAPRIELGFGGISISGGVVVRRGPPGGSPTLPSGGSSQSRTSSNSFTVGDV